MRVCTERILELSFPKDEGYFVTVESEGDDSRPGFTAFKMYCRPGGTLYEYEYLIVESKRTVRRSIPSSHSYKIISAPAKTNRRTCTG
jgi:hypothetical protein